MMLKKTLLSLALVLSLSACGDDRADADVRHLLDTDISGFEVLTGQGEKVALSSVKKSKDKPVVVNVWATWCAPCVKELPELLALHKSGESEVIAISTNRNMATVKRYLDEHKLQGLNVVYDPQGKNTREQLAAYALPTTYITDANLIVQRIEKGEREWSHHAVGRMIKNSGN